MSGKIEQVTQHLYKAILPQFQPSTGLDSEFIEGEIDMKNIANYSYSFLPNQICGIWVSGWVIQSHDAVRKVVMIAKREVG